MNPEVKKVVPMPEYRLRITFANREVRIFDVKPFLDKGVFRQLRDPSTFASVHPWHGTVQWSGGQDLCPDTLYEESEPVAARKPLRYTVPQSRRRMVAEK
jgi:hypothetical protein